jgi:hypothetical protein
MTGSGIIWAICAGVTVPLALMVPFVLWALPSIESPTVSGLLGVVIGSLVGLVGSTAAALVNVWKVTREAEQKLQDRISNHALQLTQMDFELRQKSLERSRSERFFLAPAKVYRTFYRALLALHTTGEWPKEVEELGLLNIFALGPRQERPTGEDPP